MNQYFKFVQRRLFTFLNTGVGCSIVVVFVFLTLQSLIRAGSSECGFSPLGFLGGNAECWRDPFKDNIGGVSQRAGLAYAPIDAVYTWVNGSDPVWIKKMQFWKEKMLAMEPREVTAVDDTTTNSTTNATEESDSHSLNRYRDSNELKYSLRSLELYAPWIHKIYIVTDNQVPNWLDITHPRIKMISHKDIFDNISHLPVFSSPAIEAHLHRIPGLSKKFIYFNDDVMLGKPVLPEDFTSVSGVQKFYFAWDVPKCAPGCSDNWIGDGYCDRACNVSSCNFDFPDCVNVTSNVGRNTRHDGQKAHTAMCSKGCPETWVADKTCDNKCKNEECGWDVGDCGLDILEERLPHVVLALPHVSFSMSNRANSTAPQNDFNSSATLVTPLPSTEERGEDGEAGHDKEPNRHVPLVMVVANGTKAVYFNMSFLPCQALYDKSVPCKHNFSYSSASYNAEDGLVHQAILLNKHDILSVLLFHGQEGAPTHPGCPSDVEFSISGSNAANGMTVEIKFRMRIVENDAERERDVKYEGIPPDLHPIEGRCASCPETAEMEDFVYAHGSPVAKSLLLEQPFRTSFSPLQGLAKTFDSNGHSGAVLRMTLNPHILDRVQYEDLSTPSDKHIQIGDELLGNIFVRQSITSPSMPMIQSVVPLCSALAENVGEMHDRSESRLFRAMFPPSSKARFNCYGTTLRQFLNSSANQKSLNNVKPKPKYPNVLFAVDAQKNMEKDIGECVENSLFLLIFLPNNYTKRPVPTEPIRLTLENETLGNLSTALPTNNIRWFQSRIEFFRLHNAVNVKPLDSVKATEADFFSDAITSLLHVDEPMAMQSLSTDLVAKKSSLFGSVLRGVRFMCLLSNIKWQYNVLAPPIDETSSSNETTSTETVLSRRLLLVTNNKATNRNIAIIRDGEDEAHLSRTSGLKSHDLNVKSLRTHVTDMTILRKRATSFGARSEDMRAVLKAYTTAGEKEVNFLQPSAKLNEPENTKSAIVNALETCIDISMKVFTAIFSLGTSEKFEAPGPHRRLTSDTYGQSLIHVNRIYHKTFGSENRKVPAHLPHLIDTEIMEEMQQMFKEEWQSTSAHRFRSPRDMQYAFSYYYYVMNRNKAKPPSVYEYVTMEIDTNHDGYLDNNEFLTLASIVAGKSPADSQILNYYDCAFRRGNYSNLTHSFNESGVRLLNAESKLLTEDEMVIRKRIGSKAIRKIEKIVQDRRSKESSSYTSQPVSQDESISTTTVSNKGIRGGIYEEKISIKRFPSVEDTLGCPMIVSELRDRVGWPATHSVAAEKGDVAFEMIGDNFTDSISQLNSIRARRPKFICINDNMKFPSDELMQAFADFFSAMYPFPSRFELTDGAVNPSLYTDELMTINKTMASKVFAILRDFAFVIASILLFAKSSLVALLRMIVTLLDGGDDNTGVFVMLRRVGALKGTANRDFGSSSYFYGWVTSHDHGYEFNSSGTMVHTVSMALPFSFLIVNITAAVLIIWIYRSVIKKKSQLPVGTLRSQQSIPIRAPLLNHDEVAKLDGVTAPKLAVAASVEVPVSTSSKFGSMWPKKDESEDYLNKLWRKAGYNGGEAVENIAPEIAQSSWEDSEHLLDNRFEGRERHDSYGSHDSISSLGASEVVENSNSSNGYDHGILKKEGVENSSRRIKSVRFTKVEEEARPRVISLPGRLISGLLNAAGRGQNKESAEQLAKIKRDIGHED